MYASLERLVGIIIAFDKAADAIMFQIAESNVASLSCPNVFLPVGQLGFAFWTFFSERKTKEPRKPVPGKIFYKFQKS